MSHVYPKRSGALDPAIPLAKKGFNSRAMIDACKPYEWLSEFPKVVTSNPRVLEDAAKKWRGLKTTAKKIPG